MNEQELKYKIGQMLIVGFAGLEVQRDSLISQQISECALGGVILFDYNFTSRSFYKNIASPEQVAKLNQDLQTINRQANEKFSRPNLPLFISVDYEGGKVDRLLAKYGFPATLPVAEVGNLGLDAARAEAVKMSQTLAKAGFNLNYAPVVDVNINTENPILGKMGRCFSIDPEQVATFANIFAEEFLKAGIIPVCKHFPGHGSSFKDSHLGFVDVTETWDNAELLPYQKMSVLNNRQVMVMTAHIVNRNLDDTGLPATLSAKILSNLLRDELGFSGIIITDDMQMKAIADNYDLEESLVLAINAGVNMFIFGNQLVDRPQNPQEIINIIYNNVQQGKISPSLIEAAYTKIKNCKRMIGYA